MIFLDLLHLLIISVLFLSSRNLISIRFSFLFLPLLINQTSKVVHILIEILEDNHGPLDITEAHKTALVLSVEKFS